MTKTILTGLVAECFDASAGTPLPGEIHQLVREALERTMHQEATRQAVSGDSEGLAVLGRSITVDEGRLLESVVIALARRNPDIAVLSGLKLPVSDAALALIERNADDGTIGSLSLDPEGRSRRHYHPDLVLANRRTAEAIVIDVKRSLAGYLGGSKLSELKNRRESRCSRRAHHSVAWRNGLSPRRASGGVARWRPWCRSHFPLPALPFHHDLAIDDQVACWRAGVV